MVTVSGVPDEPNDSNLSQQIQVPQVPEELGKTLYTEARQSDEQERLRLDRDAADNHADRDQARRLRSRYARNIHFFVFLWMGAIFVLLLAQGMGSFSSHPFYLTEKVMLAAIGSTTVNVLALLVIVLKFIFPSDPK